MNVRLLQRLLQLTHSRADNGAWTRATRENEISNPNFSSQLRGTKWLGVLINELERRENSIGGNGAARQLVHLRLTQPEEQARGHDVRNELDLSSEPDSFIFLTLPTPHAGYEYDLRAFTAGSTSVGKALAASPARHTVVVRSTVSPGTTEGLVKTALEENSGMVAGEGFALASNPEFLRAASAVEDFQNPWMTVIASRDPQTVERLRALLSPFGGDMRTFTNPAEAEFVKCAHNIFNAAKISFWNEMWLVAREIGLDLDPIAATVAKSAEGSINPQYGIRGGAPYGGVCLPKDTCGFLGYADSVGVDMQLLRAVVQVNEHLEKVVSSEVAAAEQVVPDNDRA